MWLLDHLWPGRRPFLPGRGRATGTVTPALAETPGAGGAQRHGALAEDRHAAAAHAPLAGAV